MPLPFLPQNHWAANTSKASLIETEEAARGEHILDEATVAHRISALRQLNGATRTGHRYAKSTGARNSTFSQPVIVRTYSGTRPQSRQREPSVRRDIHNMGRAELPPVEAFSFKGIMESIHTGVTEDLERIAEICARSRYSLSNQYEVHMPPHGDGDPFLLNTAGGAIQTGALQTGALTLEAIASDDEQPRPNGRTRGNRQRTKSMAYGTLETIYSSSKSSEEGKTKKKPAKAIAEEVRGRAAKKALPVPDILERSASDPLVIDKPEPRQQRPKHARSQSASFASMLIDTVQGMKSDVTPHLVSSTILISEPARPKTSTAEQYVSPILKFTTNASSNMPSLDHHESEASTLRPVSEQTNSLFSNLSSWLPWSRGTGSSAGSSTLAIRRPSYAEGRLRQILEATEGDRKGKGVDQTR